MIKFTVKSVLVLFSLMVMNTVTFAETRNFGNPRLQGTRLDWCYNWAANCGQRVADAFCRRRGFVRSTQFQKANNVGVPTRLIGNPAQVCSGAACDSFRYIRCWRPSPARVFNKPRIQGTRLDWCHSWAANCGKPAADAFCRLRGYGRALGFQKAVNVGVPTRIISNPAQVCNHPDCDSFRFIRCGN